MVGVVYAGLLLGALSGCSSPPSVHSSPILSDRSVVKLTWTGTTGSSAPTGVLEVSGGECATECALSVNWSSLSLSDVSVAGHSVHGAGITLAHWVDGTRFQDHTFTVNSSLVATTLEGNIDGSLVSEPLYATDPLSGTFDPASNRVSVLTDLQSSNGSLLVHVFLNAM